MSAKLIEKPGLKAKNETPLVERQRIFSHGVLDHFTRRYHMPFKKLPSMDARQIGYRPRRRS